jgi:hypothetical protein
MTSYDHLPRLAVVASIIGEKCAPARSAGSSLISAARLGGGLLTKAESSGEAEPTPSERALAHALHQDGQANGLPADRAMAELLLLADDVPAAGDLSAGLSQALLPRHDSEPALAGEERRSAFADLYRRLALHQLNSQVRNKASATLGKLARRAPDRSRARGLGTGDHHQPRTP